MLETLSMTGITGELQVCHKLHLNSYDTCSFTLFTTSTLSIKGEPTMGECPYWTQSKCVLLSQKACIKHFKMKS